MTEVEPQPTQPSAAAFDGLDEPQTGELEEPLPTTMFSRPVDLALSGIGTAISWLWPVLMAVIVVNVAMKNLLGDGRIEFEEIQWHIYAAGFMLGLSWTLVRDEHVRVDILYDNFKPRTKAWVDLLGIIALLIPFLALLIWYGIPFVADSIATAERSSSPAGLPHRWIIKSMLVAGAALLLLAALSRLTRVAAFLFAPRIAAPVKDKDGD